MQARQYLTVLFMLAAFALILIIILIRRGTERYLNEVLVTRLNSIMKDTIIIITITTLALYLEFMDVFDQAIDVNGICLAFLIFALVWLALSAVLIVIGQSFCNKWQDMETCWLDRGSTQNFDSVTNFTLQSGSCRYIMPFMKRSKARGSLDAIRAQ